MLSPAERRDYQNLGFISPLDAYSPQEAQDLLRRFEALESDSGGPGSLQGTTRQYRPHLLLPWAADVVRHPPLLDAVEALIGPEFWSTTSPSGSRSPVAPATSVGIKTARTSA
ncbi:MAG: hypothetical protein K0U93_12955 [Gammaproteobacteria bacterium]|nr:hypothetical protein [Gammaproteobacteria bacterium]